MKNKKIFRTKDIVSIFIAIGSLLITFYVSFLLLHENLGIGQTLLSFILLISLFLTLFFAIGLIRYFTGFVKKSWIFYIFQFLFAFIVSSVLVSIFASQVVTHSQNTLFTTVKSELIPTISYIENYQKKYGKVPKNLNTAPIKLTMINNIYYYNTLDSFLLGVYGPSLDIDGIQIFYDSRDKNWYQFHNDMYQYYKDKNEKPKSIKNYISFQEQPGISLSSLKKIDGNWIDPREETKKDSQKHLKDHQKRCEENHGASCTAVGMRYGMGLETIQSYTKALKYFTKACELEDKNGCDYLADMYARGNGIEKNTAKSIELYKKACDLGIHKKYCTDKNSGKKK